MKKVLIITYYWPPAGGPGVLRWLKFSRYLPEFGIEPIIYTPKNPTYPIVDHSLEQEIPENIKIIKKKIREPYVWASLFSKKETGQISSGNITSKQNQSFLQKLLLYIRGNFFIPDARILWRNPSVKFLKKFLAENKIDTIITTGPPHSLHLIGLRLKNQMKLKWIADFRDPWTDMWYFDQLRLGKAAKRKHYKREKQVLRQADLVITTSKQVAYSFKKYTIQPIKNITNGFDSPAPFQHLEKDKAFSIAHIGSFFSAERFSALWQSLAELIEEKPEFGKHLKLKFAGKVNPELKQVLKKYQLLEYSEILGYLPHPEVLKIQQQAQVLLLQYANEKNPGIIPGKLFEYLNSGRPILAIGPQTWEAKDIIEETQTGKFFNLNDKEKLKMHLFELFKAYQKNELFVDAKNVEQFHRKNLTARLSELILNME